MSRLLAVAVAIAVMGALAATAIAATKEVEVDDDYFVKRTGSHTVSVKRGDTVKWEWEGMRPHNVTVRSGPVKFKSKTQTKGTYRKRMTRRGTYRIVCTLHTPGMRMTLCVR